MRVFFLPRITNGRKINLFLSGILFLFASVTIFAQSNERIAQTSPWAQKGLKEELEGKRSRTSKHFSDGKNVTAFISPSSIHYLNSSNAWDEISTDIAANNSVTHPYASVRNSIKTYFPANPFSDFILMNAKEGSFKEKVSAIKFLDASKNVISSLPISGPVSVSVNGNKISYTGFHPHLALNYSLGSDARKFDLAILSASFLSSVPVGAQYIMIEETFISNDGNASLRSKENEISVNVAETEVLGFAKPQAFDSNVAVENSLEGSMSFSKNNNSFSLRSDFALSWISNPVRSYPIHLDPTVNYYPQSVTLWTGQQTSNAAKASGYLRIVAAATASWAKFDITSLPVGAFVQSANFWGYHYTSLASPPKICEIRGLGTVEPVAAAAGPLFTQSYGGPLYDNTYVFAGPVFGWYTSVLGGSASTDIAAAQAQGWFGLGFGYLSGYNTFAYVYGWDAPTTTNKPYIEVTYFTTPCSGAPASNTITAPIYSICPSANPGGLTMIDTYTTSGISYQWESSSTGINGVYTAISNATNASLPTTTLGASTAYRAIVTCSNNPGGSTTISPILITVGAPAISNAVAAIPLICTGGTGSLSLGTNYAGLGVGYQWQSSTVNIVGPYANVATGTNAATSGTTAVFNDPGLTVTNYYQAILSCTAAPSLSSISVPVAVTIAGTTTNSIPYYEGFEGVSVNNLLPNCSWSATSPSLIAQTYTAANTNNRIPNNGSKFAAFQSGTNPAGDYFYTNGLQLNPGITYSASVWYTTDGGIGWTNLALLFGSSQSSSALTTIVSNTNTLANTNYLSLSGTFTVNTSGLYYLAIRAIGNGVAYLSIDDIAVTIPCSVNSPTLAANGPTAVCSGQPFVYSATGANGYVWPKHGITTSTANITLASNDNVVVVGTSSASGCSSTLSIPVSVNPSPPVSVSAANNATYVCKGSSIALHATGAGQNSVYSWSSGTTGISILVSPTVTTTYTVVGLNANGCSASAIQQIAVKTPPTVSTLSSGNQICNNETATLTATGANTYTWTSNNSFLIGTQVVVAPHVTTTYTIVGSDALKCEGTSIIAVSVSECLGLSEVSSIGETLLYPNPSNGRFTLEFNNANVKTIEVIDLTGRTVLSTRSGALKTELTAADLADGVYYVKISDSKTSKAIKFIKQ